MELKINKKEDGKKIEFELEGQLNTATAPSLSKEVDAVKDSCDSIVFECLKLDYVSSAGLRVFIATDEAVRDKGGMILKNVNQFVYEILDDVGFTDFMKIEKA